MIATSEQATATLDRPNWPVPTRFAVLDVETTGLEPGRERIIELAVVEADAEGQVLEEWSSLVGVPGTDEPGAGFVHGITRAMLEDAPRFGALAGPLLDRLAGKIVVGHVLEFDLTHLRVELGRIGVPLPCMEGASLCTRDLARMLELPRPHTLFACCELVGVAVEGAHSALGDARATAGLLASLLQRHPGVDLGSLAAAAHALAWPPRWLPAGTVTARRTLGDAVA